MKPCFSTVLGICLALCLFSCGARATLVAQNNTMYSVVFSQGEWKIDIGKSPAAVAWGKLVDLDDVTGCSNLYISTADVNAKEQSYAAGYLEGVLTANSSLAVVQQYAGFTLFELMKSTPMYQFFLDWQTFIQTQSELHGAHDPYWAEVGLMWTQLEGLMDGFNAVQASSHTQLPEIAMVHMINALEELNGIAISLNMGARHRDMVSKALSVLQKDRPTHCSGLVRLLGSPTSVEDVLFSHCTWSSYTTMLRISKSMRFGSKVSYTMSSYPLTLHSLDDFLVTSRGLAIMETTNEVYNTTLFKMYVRANGTIPEWVRSMVATKLSGSSKEWVDVFSKYNSGTYNNQYMVLDYWKLARGSSLPAQDIFHIVEQIPGYMHQGDMTSKLHSQGYWSSFNVPYFSDVYQMSGWAAMYQKTQDPEYLHDGCARARIFARDAPNVHNMEGMRRIMRSNDYTHDPISNGNPTFAISSRYDLFPKGSSERDSFGAIDCKITSLAQAMDRGLLWDAVFGPTHQSLPAFDWGTSGFSAVTNPHLKQPNKFDFPWVSPYLPGQQDV